MRLSSVLIILVTFLAAAGVSVLTASFSVRLIEASSEIEVRAALDAAEAPWAEVQADGLTVTLSGIAPTEAELLRAISTAGTVVDAARIIDEMAAKAVAAIAPPRFSAEILRNDAGVSVIGLIPAATDRAEILNYFSDLVDRSDSLTDLLETADYPTPDGWNDAMAFALKAVSQLPRAKVSVAAGRVDITAISDSAADKAAIEERLRRAAPPGLRLGLNIAAPRPVITPFTLRFIVDSDGPRFDACSADSEKAQARILDAARSVGFEGADRCTIGMGVPSPNWARAVEQSIKALDSLGGGSVTFSDADITLVAPMDTEQSRFDRVVGELENSLPEVFALASKLPQAPDPSTGPAEFIVTLSPEGQVQLRGRLNSENLRTVADSFAKSRFGTDNVYTAARVVEALPRDWPTRVLAGLEALANLSNGAVTVTPDTLRISGNTGNPDANSQVAAMLASKLGDTATFDIKITYREKLDPIASLPTPDECEAQIKAIMARSKITFEPASATIDAQTLATVDEVAEVLKECGDLRLEIQGHTDSQGREKMNEQLSQARAQSVLNELRVRRVRTASYIAVGYGETQPIQPNDTEEGREANRRIEFHLIRPAPKVLEGDSTLEALAESGDTVSDQDAASDSAATDGTTEASE